MQAELSFLDLILGASFLVQLVMVILFILAGISWWFIFDKWLTLSRAKKDIFIFENEFWNSKNIVNIFNDLKRKQDISGLSQIFIISYQCKIVLHHIHIIHILHLIHIRQLHHLPLMRYHEDTAIFPLNL